ncbi:MAG: erythromycin esterase family protein [Bacteroidota bacterium]|nr:erythromycin esterase family protein [Bacteroidota bacterium]
MSYSQKDSAKFISEIDILKKDLDSCRVFLSGESHQYVKTNSKIKLELLSFLHDQYDFKNLIIELGYSRGYMIDQYINNDTSYFELLASNTDKQYLDFYRKLRQLNLTYPENKKIRVYGIDVERFPEDGFILMKKILDSNLVVPDTLSFVIENINAFSKYFMSRRSMDTYDIEDDEDNYKYNNTTFYNSKTIDTLIREYSQYRTVFQNYLKQDFELFDKVIQTVVEFRKYEKYSSMPHQYVYRETYMFNQLKSLMAQNPTEKFYGQFGRCHVSQTELNSECNWWAFNALAKRIQNKLPDSKIISIGIFYENSSNYNYFGQKETNEELEKYYSLSSIEDSRLMKIGAKDTFLRKHYQYLIVVKNPNLSKWSSSDNEKKYLDIGFGQSYYQFNNLNQTIAGNSFSNNVFQYHIGFNNYKDRARFGYSISGLFRNEINGTEAKYRMGGSSISGFLGYEFVHKQRFSLSLSGLLAYKRLNLLVEKNPGFSSPNINGFTNLDVVKFFNPAIIIGTELDVRHDLGRHFCVFVKGNYNWDFSRKKWYQSVGNGSRYLKQSPTTTLGTYGWMFGFGLKL